MHHLLNVKASQPYSLVQLGVHGKTMALYLVSYVTNETHHICAIVEVTQWCFSVCEPIVMW